MNLKSQQIGSQLFGGGVYSKDLIDGESLAQNIKSLGLGVRIQKKEVEINEKWFDKI